MTEPEIDEDENPTLLGQVVALRGELAMARRKELAFRLFVLAVILAGLFLYVGQKNTTDEIVATRTQSRAGLCAAIDDMRERHNHFVQTAIDERMDLIAATEANPKASAQQKADSEFFFRQQIAKYQQDLLDIIDCSNPDAVASLFTKPGG